MIVSLLAGVLAGGLHVLAGPDHLAAVAPLAIRARWRAWLAGAQWGFGHTLAVAALGLLFWWLRDALPLERVSAVSEQIVGVVLVAIGLWTLRNALGKRLHLHRHQHDGKSHVHMHVHRAGVPHEASNAHDHSHASFWVGVLHGGAGSAHFVAILPALSFPAGADAVSFLAGYGLGTIATMVGVAMALGSLAQRAGTRPSLYRGMLAVVGSVAVIVGGVWLVP